jgi:hypothetical protein
MAETTMRLSVKQQIVKERQRKGAACGHALRGELVPYFQNSKSGGVNPTGLRNLYLPSCE